MEEYKLETRIREIVLELSAPNFNRISTCLKKLDENDSKLEQLTSKLLQIEVDFSAHQQACSLKLKNIDNEIKTNKKLLDQYSQSQKGFQQEIIGLKSQNEKLILENDKNSEKWQHMISRQIQYQQELDQCNRKTTDKDEMFSKKIEEFFKQFSPYFIESRNHITSIQKDLMIITKELNQQKQLIQDLNDQNQKIVFSNQSLKREIDIICDEQQQFANKEDTNNLLAKETIKITSLIAELKQQMMSISLEHKDQINKIIESRDPLIVQTQEQIQYLFTLIKSNDEHTS